MGLILAAKTAIDTMMADQWKEFIKCDSMSSEVIIKKGKPRDTKNNNFTDNIITKDSVIIVNEGQAIIVVDNGKIVDFCAEAGAYVFDKSTEPSIFTGELGESVKQSFKTVANRFTFAGAPGTEQAVYYVNTKKLIGYKFGTMSPILYNDPIYMSLEVRFAGTTALKIVDPILLFTELVGNISTEYNSKMFWDNQLRTEFVMYMGDALATLSRKGISFNQLTQYQVEISEEMNLEVRKKWTEKKGIVIEDVALSSISVPPEYNKKIHEIDMSRVMSNNDIASGRMRQASATALESAAANENGSLLAFAGLNMAQQASTNNVNALNNSIESNPSGWACKCGTTSNGEFCSNCGTKKASSANWLCKCGASNTGNFCSQCGEKNSVPWLCKCGTNNTGNFCSECGEKQN